MLSCFKYLPFLFGFRRLKHELGNINQIDSPQFRSKDKREVTERWVLLRRKFRSKIREEAAASGVVVEDLTEKEVLIEELIERQDTIKPDDNLSVQQTNDKDKAEDIRKKVMESMGKKKRSENHRGERLMMISQQTQAARDAQSRQWISCTKMLTTKGTFCQKELDIKRKEQEKQQETMQAMMLQQGQMNQAFISVVKK